MADLDATDAWQGALTADPTPALTIAERSLDDALAVMGEFADLKSPWTRAHSVRVAELAGAAAAARGEDGEAAALVRRAGFVHDLGQVGVPNGIWDRPASLGRVDWEQVRLHALWGERALSAAGPLQEVASLVGAHHERLDGSGYHRRLDGVRLDRPARVLAAADAYAAMRESRPHRAALDPGAAAGVLRDEVRNGRLDRDAVDAVLAAAGQPTSPARRCWPRGLSDREVEVLRLIARGRTNREVAGELHLSAKTVGRHVENLYLKIGVSSWAAAAVFAMQERLLDP